MNYSAWSRDRAAVLQEPPVVANSRHPEGITESSLRFGQCRWDLLSLLLDVPERLQLPHDRGVGASAVDRRLGDLERVRE